MVVSVTEVFADTDGRYTDVIVQRTGPVTEIVAGTSVDVVSGNSVLNASVGATSPPDPHEGQIWIKF